MEAILAIIIEYASIWAPSLCAILGIAITVITAIAKVKKSIDEFKKQDVMEELTKEIHEQNKLNKELVHCEKLLLDNITHVKDYAANKSKEEENDKGGD